MIAELLHRIMPSSEKGDIIKAEVHGRLERGVTEFYAGVRE